MDRLSETGGFDFSLCSRNAMLGGTAGANMPKTKKTGTTIAGVIFKDGVVLGADTRATEGSIVCDKNCEKIHYIASKIYCCGAGTSADTEATTAMISSQLELHRLATGKEARVGTACNLLSKYLFRYQGYVSAALILGGVDITGPSLYTVYPHGSVDRLPFVTMGSGSLAAMAQFEVGFKDGMTEEEAKALVHKAITAGIWNDLGSGSNVDLCVITKDGVKYLRNYDTPNDRKFRRPYPYNLSAGITPVISTVRYTLADVEVTEAEAMQE